MYEVPFIAYTPGSYTLSISFSVSNWIYPFPLNIVLLLTPNSPSRHEPIGIFR
nr:MAG TPA: hypothetical protein [Herelleviridae sp.]